MKTGFARVVLFILVALLTQSSFATENGRSTYAPGTAGDFSIAVLPEAKGFYLRNELWYYTANNTYQALNGAVSVDADLTAWVDIPRMTWVSGWTLLGARHGAYLTLPAAFVTSKANIEQNVPGQPTSSITQKGDRLSFSDIYFAPVILDWKVGSVDIMWMETATIPSGTYDSDRTVNVSRNHWALNSSLAATWRHPSGGPELDARLGYIVNSENPDTEYRSGNELALDWTAAWRLDQQWAMGVTGYAYEQLTGDRGDGAVLGDFKGRSVGAGPIVRRIFSCGDRRMALVGKWIHEFDASNRYEGDLFFVALSTRL